MAETKENLKNTKQNTLESVVLSGVFYIIGVFYGFIVGVYGCFAQKTEKNPRFFQSLFITLRLKTNNNLKNIIDL